jgi:hypothetical protein
MVLVKAVCTINQDKTLTDHVMVRKDMLVYHLCTELLAQDNTSQLSREICKTFASRSGAQSDRRGTHLLKHLDSRFPYISSRASLCKCSCRLRSMRPSGESLQTENQSVKLTIDSDDRVIVLSWYTCNVFVLLFNADQSIHNCGGAVITCHTDINVWCIGTGRKE